MDEHITDIRKKHGYPNGSTTLCIENLGIYKYDATSTEADDGDTVLRPVLTTEGRWLKVKTLAEYTAPEA